MGIRINLPIVEAMYDTLRLTKPFVRWKLPDADDISFAITRSKTDRGEFYINSKGHATLGVSEVLCTTLDELMRILAHEMCHLHEHLHGPRKDVHHGSWFNAAADKVCKAHNFDRGAF